MITVVGGNTTCWAVKRAPITTTTITATCTVACVTASAAVASAADNVTRRTGAVTGILVQVLKASAGVRTVVKGTLNGRRRMRRLPIRLLLMVLLVLLVMVCAVSRLYKIARLICVYIDLRVHGSMSVLAKCGSIVALIETNRRSIWSTLLIASLILMSRILFIIVGFQNGWRRNGFGQTFGRKYVVGVKRRIEILKTKTVLIQIRISFTSTQ